MIDIIIPAYNCSKTLPKLLASIGAQTKPEKCIVTIVDDCSTEDLKPIIRDFKKYFNIKLQYIRLEENLKWPGLVRQAGLDRTNAPYVMFLDSDDFLSPRAVELAIREMRSTNSDVIIGSFYGEDRHNQWNLFEDDKTTWLHGNIYKRSFLKNNNIHFEALYNEDGSFNTECFILAERISYLPEPIYFWSRNPLSITKSEFFKINNNHFFVKSLQKTYDKLFQKTDSDELFFNMGRHLFAFYRMLDQEKYLIIEKNDEKAEKSNILFSTEIKNFVLFLEDKKLSAFQIELIKSGFKEMFDELGIEGDYVSISDYWQIFSIDKVLGELILDESSNN